MLFTNPKACNWHSLNMITLYHYDIIQQSSLSGKVNTYSVTTSLIFIICNKHIMYIYPKRPRMEDVKYEIKLFLVCIQRYSPIYSF